MRKFIRSSAIKEITFLGNIGSAHIEKETEKIVHKLLNENLDAFKSQTEDINSENVSEYINEIMDEIKRIKGKS